MISIFGLVRVVVGLGFDEALADLLVTDEEWLGQANVYFEVDCLLCLFSCHGNVGFARRRSRHLVDAPQLILVKIEIISFHLRLPLFLMLILLARLRV